MASVYVSIGKAPASSPYGNSPVFEGPITSEVITSSGTAAAGALTGGAGKVAQIVCASAVYARTNGTATPATGVYVPADIPVYIAIGPGQVVNVIDV
jgi:hypothetical protein